MPHAVLIDDDINNLNILAQLLLEEGVTSTKIMDVTHLNSMLTNIENIDIVFLDLEMPKINGYELFEQLQSDQRFDSIPIVAHTVYLSELHDVAQRGFHSFIGKPINADKFPNQLASILNGKHIWEAL